MKQELFIIRNNQKEDHKKLGLIEDAVKKLQPSKTHTNVENDTSEETKDKTKKNNKMNDKDDNETAKEKVPTRDEPKETKQSSVLFIGDSITNTLDYNFVAQATTSRITRAKAYSSIREDIPTIAKQAAKYPHLNFTDVAKTELGKKQFETLILQSGSVDVTNLITRDNATDYFEYFNQETIKSAENLFKVTEDSMINHPSLEKVVILKHIPR